MDDELCQCGFCGHIGNVTEFSDDPELPGSKCPKCGDVADSPPYLRDEQPEDWIGGGEP
jgi:hypothetical protein